MKVLRILIASMMLIAFSTNVYAQDANTIENKDFGVKITPPAKWEVTQGNDKAIANFKHRGSQSQIEVVGTKLMTPDVADVFFKTFHKTLQESNFEETKKEEDVAIGDLKGTQTQYKFTHSGVTLSVIIYQFLRENTAWLVVGYMQDVDKDKYTADFKSVVENIKFN